MVKLGGLRFRKAWFVLKTRCLLPQLLCRTSSGPPRPSCESDLLSAYKAYKIAFRFV